MQSIITLDVGTSSIRANVFSDEGERLFAASNSYTPTFLNDGRVRQSPDDWVRGAYDVLSRCRKYVEDGGSVAAISLASQRASVVALDRYGAPLGEAIMWQDRTTLGQCTALLGTVSMEEAYRITGLRIDPYFSAPKIMWIRDQEPQAFAQATHFVGVQDYIALALTGTLVTDASQASRTLLMDIASRTWSDVMLEAAQIERSMLPEIVEPGTIVGTLCADAARRTGLSIDTPLVLAGGDQQVAAIGMGVISPGTVETNTGTGSFLISPVSQPTFHPEARTLCSAAAIPDRWVAEAGVLTTGIVYRWFAREFVGEGTLDQESAMFERLNRMIESSPAGANGVIVLPHFKGSAAPFWDPYARGMFFNLTPAHTRSDMARAVLESIVLEMGANLELLRSVMTHPISKVMSAGGLTNFALFNQLQADVFDLPVGLSATVEATSVGALLSATVALGAYASWDDAFETICKHDEQRVEPRSSVTALYRQTTEVREALYHALHDSGVYETTNRYTHRTGDR